MTVAGEEIAAEQAARQGRAEQGREALIAEDFAQPPADRAAHGPDQMEREGKETAQQIFT